MLRVLLAGLLLFTLTNPSVAAERVLLRLHGSNTIGAQLAPALVKAWLGQQRYHSIKVEKTAPEEMLVHAVSQGGQPVVVSIKAHGSSTSFKALAAGETDIGMASRPIKDKELTKLESLGPMDSHDSEFVLGLDGIAVIVHPDNPLSRLGKDELKRIFSGEVEDWSQLGITAGPIHVYARDDKSGTYDTFRSLVLGKKNPLVSGAKRFESNARLSDAVARDPNGIGFVGLPYIRQSKALAVADGGAPILPDAFTVATEDYALARRLYLYLPKTLHNDTANRFIQFAISQAGQQVVDETGFVSQAIIAGSAGSVTKLDPDYAALVNGALRLSLNFRFHRGSALLDNKARHDITRLVDYMSHPDNRKRELILIGFSDRNEVIPMKSLGLSIQRADSIADVLLAQGIAPTKVRGLGSAVSVASNETAKGRQKNRRVEVWVR